MPSFRYKAYTNDGRSTKGALDAEDYRTAVQTLAARGETPFDLQEIAARHNALLSSASGPTLGDGDMSRLFSGLRVLLDAGFNLDEALIVSQETESDTKLKRLFAAIRASIAAGNGVTESFSNALALPPNVAAVIESGAASGTLARSISRVEMLYTDRHALRKQITSTLTYPAFLIAVLILVLLLLAIDLVPAMEPIFSAGDTQMPVVMNALFLAGQFIENHWRVLSAALLAFLLILIVPATRMWFVGASLNALSKLPLIRGFMRRLTIAAYLKTLTILVEAQLPLVQALELAGRGARSKSDSEMLSSIARSVSEGRPLHDAFEESGLFERYVISLVAMGARSNNLAQMLARSAGLMEQRLSETTTRFLGVLSPAITIAIGLIVGGLVISVMTALLSINEVAIQ